MSDVMHGPAVAVAGKRRKACLIASTAPARGRRTHLGLLRPRPELWVRMNRRWLAAAAAAGLAGYRALRA